MKRTVLSLLVSFLLVSCGSTAWPVQAEPVAVYASASAESWLSDVFACANERAIVVEVEAETPDIVLRVAKLASLDLSEGSAADEGLAGTEPSFAYQIGEEEIVIAVRRDSPIQNLTLEEAQSIFAGLGDESARVWVYAPVEDLQGVFDQFVMNGRSATSFAAIASNPQQMSEALHSQADAIGFLPKRWVTKNLRIVYSLGTFPVLAVTRGEPRGATRTILGCLQSK